MSLWDGISFTIARAIPTALLFLNLLDVARSVHVVAHVLLVEFHSVGIVHPQSGGGGGAGLSEVYELSWAVSYPCVVDYYALENEIVWVFSTETWNKICVLCASPAFLACF